MDVARLVGLINTTDDSDPLVALTATAAALGVRKQAVHKKYGDRHHVRTEG